MQEELRDARAMRNDEAAATKEATGATSRYYGVYWHKRERRWHAQVWRGGKYHTIGRHDDELAAARAVDKWLSDHGGGRVNLDDKDRPLEWQKTYASIYVGVYKCDTRTKASGERRSRCAKHSRTPALSTRRRRRH